MKKKENMFIVPGCRNRFEGNKIEQQRKEAYMPK